MKKKTDYLLLKWGTLKGWDFAENPKGIELLQEYNKIGSSFSAMMQKDTARQKEIILELIDVCNGPVIYNWDGTVYKTKKAAKEYILNYGKK